MNWVIFIAVILISSISKSEPKLGGWLGVALTTGILIWGLSVYSNPFSYVTFFGITLSQGMFLLLVTAFMATMPGCSTKPITRLAKPTGQNCWPGGCRRWFQHHRLLAPV